jgi:hypothetical protein
MRARTARSEALVVRIGETIVHAKWGEGVVIDVDGEDQATIRFPSVGDKRLMLSLAPIKRA